MGLTDEYKRDEYFWMRCSDFKAGADWGYEKGRAEIRSRIAAMEAEVTAAENKTRTVQANAKEEIDRLTRELAEAKASQRGAQKHHNELLQLRKAFEKAKDEKFKALEIVERLTAENKRYWNEWSAYAAEVTRLKAELAEANRKIDCFEEALDGTVDGWRESLLAKNLAKRQGEPAKCDHERVMTNGCCYFCGVDLSAKPASAASPREWWISDECKYVEVYVGYPEPDYSSKWTHVIEKSAFIKLREENDFEFRRATRLLKERDALKAECEKLAGALEAVIDGEGGDPATCQALADFERMKGEK